MKQRNRPPRSAEKSGPAAAGWRLVLGQQAVREVIRVWGAATHQVLVQHKGSPRTQAVATFASDQNIDLLEVPRSELDRLSGGASHQGVAAWAPALPFQPWSSIRDTEGLLAVALDGVVDPQNFGAVIRSAVAVSSSPVIWAESSSAPLSPATFRASAGAIEHAKLCRVHSLHGTLSDAVAHGIEVVGLSPDAAQPLHEAPPLGPCIVVIGSEQKGMTKAVRRSCSRFVRLGQSGLVQSLNASVAAGISLYCVHASQRGWKMPRSETE